MPKKLPPDPENMNDKRAEWAFAAIEAFCEQTGQRTDGEDLIDAVGDLLADIQHFCDRKLRRHTWTQGQILLLVKRNGSVHITQALAPSESRLKAFARRESLKVTKIGKGYHITPKFK